VSPDGRRVYVSNGRGGTVSVIDPATDSVIASVPVGQRPWGIALTPDGGRLYTANGPSNDVTVVDTRDLTVVKTIPVGKLPWGVAIGQAP
jgi:YVTN family beta-propeller protein